MEYRSIRFYLEVRLFYSLVVGRHQHYGCLLSAASCQLILGFLAELN